MDENTIFNSWEFKKKLEAAKTDLEEIEIIINELADPGLCLRTTSITDRANAQIKLDFLTKKLRLLRARAAIHGKKIRIMMEEM